MKGTVQLVSLLLTIAGVVYCNRVLPGPQRRLQPRQAGLALAGVVLLFLLAWAANAPKLLQVTNPQVVAAKAENRALCAEALSRDALLEAEAFIRNNTVSVQLATNFNKHARQNLDRSLRRVNNLLFFNVGVYMSVLPLMAAVGAAAASTLPQCRALRLDRFIAPSDPLLKVALPAVNMVTAVAAVAYAGFYFWLEEAQVTGCCLHSGHWYTYTLTTFACALVQAHLVGAAAGPEPAVSAAPRWYAGWCVVYQALAWRVLKTSQQFFHDDFESRQGILSALMLAPVVAGVGFLAACDGGLLSDKGGAAATAAAGTAPSGKRPEPSAAAAIPKATTTTTTTTAVTTNCPTPPPAPPPPPPPAPPNKSPLPVSTNPKAMTPTPETKKPEQRRASIDDVFDQIKAGVKLKPVSTDTHSATPPPTEAQGAKAGLHPASSQASPTPTAGGADFLRDAVEKRRQFLRQESTKSEMDDDDDWD